MATKRPDSYEEFQRKQAAKKAGTRLPPRTHNQPSDLPALNEQRHVYVANARTAAGILRKTFETWVEVGRGLKALHDLADEIGGKQTYDKLREREGLGRDIVNKTRSSRLLAIIDNLPAVEEWRANGVDALSGKPMDKEKRFKWASPEAVHIHCPIFAKPKSGSTNFSPMAQLKQINATLQEENYRLRRDGGHYKPTDTVNDIATMLVGAFPSKAEEIARQMLALLGKPTLNFSGPEYEKELREMQAGPLGAAIAMAAEPKKAVKTGAGIAKRPKRARA
jgi:hypothetical protein